MIKLLTAVAGAALLAAPAYADPDKDESGNGYRERFERWDRGDYREDEDRDYRDYRSYRGRYSIPAGHLPPPGECRVWFYERPAGQQPPPTNCGDARRMAYRLGGRVIYGGRR